MKRIAQTSALIGALTVLSGIPAMAQKPSPTPPAPQAVLRQNRIYEAQPVVEITDPAAPNVTYRSLTRVESLPDEVIVAQALPLPPTPQVRIEEVKRQMDGAQVEEVKAEVERGQADAKRAMMNGYYASAPGKGDRPLVVRTSEIDAKTIAATEEDLNIMARILAKAIPRAGEEDRLEAMGVRLYTVGLPGGVKSMQIEGHGAIFVLNVNFPLAGLTNKADESENNKEPANSTWDEAKREIYGRPGAAGGQPYADRLFKEGYDPKRVEKLKDSLIDALKNAGNMRYLKPDETVTVLVKSARGGTANDLALFNNDADPFATAPIPVGRSGGMAGGGVVGMAPNGGMAGGGGGGGVANYHMVVRGMVGGESVLTIHAKKSDIDAFAKGKINSDEFRKKASVLIY